jgi:nitroreductase
MQLDFSMPIGEAMMTQRAIRRVKPDPVDDEIILRLLELATHAPNAKNEQSWEFIIIKDAGIKKQLAAENRKIWNLVRGKFERQGEFDPSMQKITRATQWSADNFESYPAMVVCCYKGTTWAFPPVLGASLYGSILPAVQNLLLASRAINLGANLTTIALWSQRRSRRILGLPRGIVPCVLVTLGWPLGSYGPGKRKPVGDVVSLDRYGNRIWSGKLNAGE